MFSFFSKVHMAYLTAPAQKEVVVFAVESIKFLVLQIMALAAKQDKQ